MLSRAVEAEVLPTLRELGIGRTAYGVLARGLISGNYVAGKPGDFLAHSPRFASEHLEHNLALVKALRKVAERKGCTVAQLVIAWVAAHGDDIVPLVGARTRERLTESLPALDITLTHGDFTAIEEAVPAGSARGDSLPVGVYEFARRGELRLHRLRAAGRARRVCKLVGGETTVPCGECMGAFVTQMR